MFDPQVFSIKNNVSAIVIELPALYKSLWDIQHSL